MTLQARVAGAWALMHPGPSLLTVAAYVLCAVLAAGAHPALGALALTALGMACMQFSISALNDYRDRAADARNPNKRKPLVLGAVSPGFALWSAVILAAAMFASFIPFGLVSVVLAGIFLGLGFAYDLGVKATPFSGLMLGLAFPTIPLLAWNIFAHLTPALFTVLPLGLALGLGIHLADAIPDAEADAAAGVRGLTQALGKHAPLVCVAAFYSASVFCIELTVFRPFQEEFLLARAAAFVSITLVTIAIISFRTPHLLDAVRFKRFFPFLMGSAFMTVIAWFIAVAV